MSPYQHAEAFCLMNYACDCGHREVIWNSRDGVTPFGLACPSCGNSTLFHVEFKRDDRQPQHKPYPGQRYFRDGTPDEAVAFIEQRIAQFAAQGYPVPDEIKESLLSDARNTTGEWQKGWPFVSRAPERPTLSGATP